jgi:hypothetical protein
VPDSKLEKWRRWGYVILAILFTGDIVTTTLARMVGHPELNPIMVFFVSNPFLHFVVKLSILLVIVCLIEGISFILKRRGQYSRLIQKILVIAIGILIVFYGIVVIGNIVVLLKEHNLIPVLKKILRGII